MQSVETSYHIALTLETFQFLQRVADAYQEAPYAFVTMVEQIMDERKINIENQPLLISNDDFSDTLVLSQFLIWMTNYERTSEQAFKKKIAKSSSFVPILQPYPKGIGLPYFSKKSLLKKHSGEVLAVSNAELYNELVITVRLFGDNQTSVSELPILSTYFALTNANELDEKYGIDMPVIKVDLMAANISDNQAFEEQYAAAIAAMLPGQRYLDKQREIFENLVLQKLLTQE